MLDRFRADRFRCPNRRKPVSNVSARIERLPFGRFQRRLLLMGGLGYAFDAMDAAVVAFVLPVLRHDWALTSVQTGVLGSGNFIGYFFGALFADVLGDLIGRRAVMMYALLLYSVASVVSAMTDSWPMFLAHRRGHRRGKRDHRAVSRGVRRQALSRRLHGSAGGLFFVRLRGCRPARLFHRARVPRRLAHRALHHRDTGGHAVVVAALASRIPALARQSRAPRRCRPRAGEYRSRLRAARHRVASRRNERPDRRAGSADRHADRQLSRVMGRPNGAHLAHDVADVAVDHSYYAFFMWIPGLLVQNGMSITRSFGYSVRHVCGAGARLLRRGVDKRAHRPAGDDRLVHAVRRRVRARHGVRENQHGNHDRGHLPVVFHERHVCGRVCLYGRSLSDGRAHDRRRHGVGGRAHRAHRA